MCHRLQTALIPLSDVLYVPLGGLSVCRWVTQAGKMAGTQPGWHLFVGPGHCGRVFSAALAPGGTACAALAHCCTQQGGTCLQEAGAAPSKPSSALSCCVFVHAGTQHEGSAAGGTVRLQSSQALVAVLTVVSLWVGALNYGFSRAQLVIP